MPLLLLNPYQYCHIYCLDPYLFRTMTLAELEGKDDTEKPFHLNIAVPWFAVIGLAGVWVVGIFISFITRHTDPPKYKSTLVSKLCRRFVPSEILEIEMKVLEEPENKTLLVKDQV